MRETVTNIRGKSGFTLIEIMIVVLIIGLLLTIAVPSFLKARDTSAAKTCIKQMRQTTYAKEAWAMDNSKATSAVPAWDDLCPLYIKDQPECPRGGNYTIGNLNTDVICSIGGLHVVD